MSDKIKWLDEPEEKDYPAAENFLSLIVHEEIASETAQKLCEADMQEFKAKDIFRAAGVTLLPMDNEHVLHDIEKIHNGIKLSPLLLVRTKGQPGVIIADGYHRLCAVYRVDEDAKVPCKIV